MDLQDLPQEVLAKEIAFVTDTADLSNLASTSHFMKEMVETYSTKIASHRRETIDVDVLSRFPNVETCLVPIKVNCIGDVCKLTSLRKLRAATVFVTNEDQEKHYGSRVTSMSRGSFEVLRDAFTLDCAGAYMGSRTTGNRVTFRNEGNLGKLSFGPGLLKLASDELALGSLQDLGDVVRTYKKCLGDIPIERMTLTENFVVGRDQPDWPSGMEKVTTLHLYLYSYGYFYNFKLGYIKDQFPSLKKLVVKVMGGDKNQVDEDNWDPDDFEVPFDVCLRMPLGREELLEIVGRENVKEVWYGRRELSEPIAPEHLAKIKLGQKPYPMKCFGIP